MIRKPRTFTATCAAGLELLVTEEIASLGGLEVNSSPGRVFFKGHLETAYRACLWSRFATRTLMPLVTFPGPDTDGLYQGSFNVDWNEHFSVDGTFAVDCTLHNSAIKHSKYAALRIKDAIVDRFRQQFGRRPSIDTVHPDIRIHAIVDKKQATLCLDLSGESLHRRGYRISGGEAPLKETLAAAIVRLNGWHTAASSDCILLDPMCGSATMLIEAALMYADIAPGLGRNYFGFLKWRGHRKALWQELVAEARDRKKQGLGRPWPRIVGYDTSRDAIHHANANIRQAELSTKIHVERQELAQLTNLFSGKARDETLIGQIVVNPPYGERLDSFDTVRYIYRFLGRKLREQFSGWQTGVFIGNHKLAYEIGIQPHKQYRLYNGPLACTLHIFTVPVESNQTAAPTLQVSENPLIKADEAFANRLRKNCKAIIKWAQRENISCYRIYDADLPEYNAAIDVYNNLVHVQEYAPPKIIDPAKARSRFKQIVQVVRDVLGLTRSQIFIKVRHRQKGRAQYQKMNNKGRMYEVQEGNCRLLVNLSDYLDTGLFLDHRITRSMVQSKAKKKRFLNLFGYTGTATVHAAVGGAKKTVTVDLSPVYLQWARSNLALNGFSDENNRLIRSDCMEWLKKTREQFDLIFADPPTFSNSKSTGRIFDIQRDHSALLRLAMRRLAPGGMLVFSTNFRRFKMGRELLSDFEVQDITRSTIPPDFKRTPRIHQCWLMRKNNVG